MSTELKFSLLVKFFQHTSDNKYKPQIRRRNIRNFLQYYCNPSNYFAAIRLILPSLDRERGSYGLKESVLALSLLDALGMSRDSHDAQKLINWRKGGAKVAGEQAGNFSQVAFDVLQPRQGSISSDLTIRELNELLDRLANAEKRSQKTEVLGELIRKTNCEEMKWIIKIILKDLKLGISETTVFKELHPDAVDLFNVTCDLRLVCEKLIDRNVRHKRQDIEVGKAVKPQLANKATSCGQAWKRLRGKDVVVECKFDGDRIQIHKDGDKVNFFSRNYIDHQEYEHGMRGVILENVLEEKCILDGEMLVWDKRANRFAEFGSNQEAAKAAREGVVSEKELCYVAFDVLYVGDTSVIHRSLRERHELLRKVVRPVKGRLEILLPSGNGKGNGNGDSLNARRHPGEPCWSIVAHHLDDVERFYKETIENRDEGIVLKDLGSKWDPGDRSGKWFKFKPDYVHVGSDLDVLIIGGYYGSGRRGGEVAQFLVGLAEKPSTDTFPRRFISFCRVGTGLSDQELDELVTKLKPYFRKYEYPKKAAPSFYQVTNHSKERPDVWVESPEKSVIVAITSDIRTINSEVFSAPYSLRFPRIDRVRYDKPWNECLDVQSFIDLVHSSNGTTMKEGEDDGGLSIDRRKRRQKGQGKKKSSVSVPSHLAWTDVSSVKGESKIFSNMVFHFVNVPSDHSLDSLHKLVVENGGTFSMNLNDTVTHCVGAQSRGIKYEAAKRRGFDVIHYSWVLDCCSQKQLLPLRPTHYVFLSEPSKKKLQEEIDEFSDSYYWDLNVAELKQILCTVNSSEDVETVEYYRKKYSPNEKWCCFVGCCIYFHLFSKTPAADWEILSKIALRRMRVEVSAGGGKVVDNPSQATHIVVAVTAPGYELNFETLLQSFPEDKKRVVRRKRVHVVGSQWLNDCFKEEKKLPEEAYNLKPSTMEESSLSEEEEVAGEMDCGRLTASPPHEEQLEKPVPEEPPKVVPLFRESKRKRGRVAGTGTRKRKATVRKPPTTKRARVGNRRAKLREIASDDEMSNEANDVPENASPELEVHDHVFEESSFDDDKSNDQESNARSKSGSETEKDGSVRGSESLQRNEEAYMEEEHKPRVDEKRDQSLDTASTVLCSKPDKERGYSALGKSETKLDPFQAVLAEFMPRLAAKTFEPANPALEDTYLPPPTSNEVSSSLAPVSEPVKKKKVSYRELANSLLND